MLRLMSVSDGQSPGMSAPCSAVFMNNYMPIGCRYEKEGGGSSQLSRVRIDGSPQFSDARLIGQLAHQYGRKPWTASR